MVGDARDILATIPAHSVDLSFWSPPYHVGKSYERGQSIEDWCELVGAVIREHARILRPGCFMAVNIGDILCYPDNTIPRFQADNVRGKRVRITRTDVLNVQRRYPNANRRQIAKILGCSEQTVQRRVENNNVRGGKSAIPTKVLLTGAMLASMAEECGLYLYDQRIWHKDPCWVNSQWHTVSYRAVDEFEHVYVFWNPGITDFDRERLEPGEWAAWGSRGVWNIRSVRSNRRHEAEFPEELAERVIRLFAPARGVVLDPFVGTGTTTTVAARLGQRWFGIDDDQANVRMARERTNGS